MKLKYMKSLPAITAVIFVSATSWGDIEIRSMEYLKRGEVAAVTNFCSAKISEEGRRFDVGSHFTHLELGREGTRFELYHLSKEYVRHSISNQPAFPHVPFECITTNEVKMGSNLLRAVAWRNGFQEGVTYLGGSRDYLEGVATNELQRVPVLHPGLPVGSLIDTGDLVVRTETSQGISGSPENGNTNVVVLVRELIGITKKEFEPDEFKIPPGYKEVKAPSSPSLRVESLLPSGFPRGAETKQRVKDLRHGPPLQGTTPETGVRAQGRLRFGASESEPQKKGSETEKQ